eukprot:CAMPEP_0180651214 /NCGR_PEP_ID=MMETSP1037_2-20121125/52725_1 /TAXON_ID=632150 /ORGANISM="Azadinium spinosum, Strain 3D9" /LENGTH=141 /DNA_ID=CAMNT_0022676767 /DNA_START=99 /DNA_END=520 /DNA_ORIENTATION=+
MHEARAARGGFLHVKSALRLRVPVGTCAPGPSLGELVVRQCRQCALVRELVRPLALCFRGLAPYTTIGLWGLGPHATIALLRLGPRTTIATVLVATPFAASLAFAAIPSTLVAVPSIASLITAPSTTSWIIAPSTASLLTT